MTLPQVLKGTIALGLASCALAMSLPPAATLENMAGAWVAVGPWGTHYRLVIDSSGHGQLALRGSSDTVFLYDIEWIAFTRQSVEARLALSNEPDERPKIRGEAYEGSMTLTGKRVFGNESIRFYPEAEWLTRQAAVRSAMRAAAQ